MSRYLGPRLRITRRLGHLIGLTRKKPFFKSIYPDNKSVSSKVLIIPPGQHGRAKLFKKKPYESNEYDYLIRLKLKQRLRYYYGVTERQLLKYVKFARKSKGSTGRVLLRLLEMRLDNIVFRLHMAPTIQAARQLISHGHILVNKKKVTLPSYQCLPADLITVAPKIRSMELVSRFLTEFDTEKARFQRILQIINNNAKITKTSNSLSVKITKDLTKGSKFDRSYSKENKTNNLLSLHTIRQVKITQISNTEAEGIAYVQKQRIIVQPLLYVKETLGKYISVYIYDKKDGVFFAYPTRSFKINLNAFNFRPVYGLDSVKFFGANLSKENNQKLASSQTLKNLDLQKTSRSNVKSNKGSLAKLKLSALIIMNCFSNKNSKKPNVSATKTKNKMDSNTQNLQIRIQAVRCFAGNNNSKTNKTSSISSSSSSFTTNIIGSSNGRVINPLLLKKEREKDPAGFREKYLYGNSSPFLRGAKTRFYAEIISPSYRKNNNRENENAAGLNNRNELIFINNGENSNINNSKIKTKNSFSNFLNLKETISNLKEIGDSNLNLDISTNYSSYNLGKRNLAFSTKIASTFERTGCFAAEISSDLNFSAENLENNKHLPSFWFILQNSLQKFSSIKNKAFIGGSEQENKFRAVNLESGRSKYPLGNKVSLKKEEAQSTKLDFNTDILKFKILNNLITKVFKFQNLKNSLIAYKRIIILFKLLSSKFALSSSSKKGNSISLFNTLRDWVCNFSSKTTQRIGTPSEQRNRYLLKFLSIISYLKQNSTVFSAKNGTSLDRVEIENYFKLFLFLENLNNHDKAKSFATEIVTETIKNQSKLKKTILGIIKTEILNWKLDFLKASENVVNSGMEKNKISKDKPSIKEIKYQIFDSFITSFAQIKTDFNNLNTALINNLLQSNYRGNTIDSSAFAFSISNCVNMLHSLKKVDLIKGEYLFIKQLVQNYKLFLKSTLLEENLNNSQLAVKYLILNQIKKSKTCFKDSDFSLITENLKLMKNVLSASNNVDYFRTVFSNHAQLEKLKTKRLFSKLNSCLLTSDNASNTLKTVLNNLSLLSSLAIIKLKNSKLSQKFSEQLKIIKQKMYLSNLSTLSLATPIFKLGSIESNSKNLQNIQNQIIRYKLSSRIKNINIGPSLDENSQNYIYYKTLKSHFVNIILLNSNTSISQKILNSVTKFEEYTSLFRKVNELSSLQILHMKNKNNSNNYSYSLSNYSLLVKEVYFNTNKKVNILFMKHINKYMGFFLAINNKNNQFFKTSVSQLLNIICQNPEIVFKQQNKLVYTSLRKMLNLSIKLRNLASLEKGMVNSKSSLNALNLDLLYSKLFFLFGKYGFSIKNETPSKDLINSAFTLIEDEFSTGEKRKLWLSNQKIVLNTISLFQKAIFINEFSNTTSLSNSNLTYFCEPSFLFSLFYSSQVIDKSSNYNNTVTKLTNQSLMPVSPSYSFFFLALKEYFLLDSRLNIKYPLLIHKITTKKASSYFSLYNSSLNSSLYLTNTKNIGGLNKILSLFLSNKNGLQKKFITSLQKSFSELVSLKLLKQTDYNILLNVLKKLTFLNKKEYLEQKLIRTESKKNKPSRFSIKYVQLNYKYQKTFIFVLLLKEFSRKLNWTLLRQKNTESSSINSTKIENSILAFSKSAWTAEQTSKIEVNKALTQIYYSGRKLISYNENLLLNSALFKTSRNLEKEAIVFTKEGLEKQFSKLFYNQFLSDYTRTSLGIMGDSKITSKIISAIYEYLFMYTRIFRNINEKQIFRKKKLESLDVLSSKDNLKSLKKYMQSSFVLKLSNIATLQVPKDNKTITKIMNIFNKIEYLKSGNIVNFSDIRNARIIKCLIIEILEKSNQDLSIFKYLNLLDNSDPIDYNLSSSGYSDNLNLEKDFIKNKIKLSNSIKKITYLLAKNRQNYFLTYLNNVNLNKIIISKYWKVLKIWINVNKIKEISQIKASGYNDKLILSIKQNYYSISNKIYSAFKKLSRLEGLQTFNFLNYSKSEQKSLKILQYSKKQIFSLLTSARVANSQKNVNSKISNKSLKVLKNFYKFVSQNNKSPENRGISNKSRKIKPSLNNTYMALIKRSLNYYYFGQLNKTSPTNKLLTDNSLSLGNSSTVLRIIKARARLKNLVILLTKKQLAKPLKSVQKTPAFSLFLRDRAKAKYFVISKALLKLTKLGREYNTKTPALVGIKAKQSNNSYLKINYGTIRQNNNLQTVLKQTLKQIKSSSSQNKNISQFIINVMFMKLRDMNLGYFNNLTENRGNTAILNKQRESIFASNQPRVLKNKTIPVFFKKEANILDSNKANMTHIFKQKQQLLSKTLTNFTNFSSIGGQNSRLVYQLPLKQYQKRANKKLIQTSTFYAKYISNLPKLRFSRSYVNNLYLLRKNQIIKQLLKHLQTSKVISTLTILKESSLISSKTYKLIVSKIQNKNVTGQIRKIFNSLFSNNKKILKKTLLNKQGLPITGVSYYLVNYYFIILLKLLRHPSIHTNLKTSSFLEAKAIASKNTQIRKNTRSKYFNLVQKIRQIAVYIFNYLKLVSLETSLPLPQQSQGSEPKTKEFITSSNSKIEQKIRLRLRRAKILQKFNLYKKYLFILKRISSVSPGSTKTSKTSNKKLSQTKAKQNRAMLLNLISLNKNKSFSPFIFANRNQLNKNLIYKLVFANKSKKAKMSNFVNTSLTNYYRNIRSLFYAYRSINVSGTKLNVNNNNIGVPLSNKVLNLTYSTKNAQNYLIQQKSKIIHNLILSLGGVLPLGMLEQFRKQDTFTKNSLIELFKHSSLVYKNNKSNLSLSTLNGEKDLVATKSNLIPVQVSKKYIITVFSKILKIYNNKILSLQKLTTGNNKNNVHTRGLLIKLVNKCIVFLSSFKNKFAFIDQLKSSYKALSSSLLSLSSKSLLNYNTQYKSNFGVGKKAGVYKNKTSRLSQNLSLALIKYYFYNQTSNILISKLSNGAILNMARLNDLIKYGFITKNGDKLRFSKYMKKALRRISKLKQMRRDNLIATKLYNKLYIKVVKSYLRMEFLLVQKILLSRLLLIQKSSLRYKGIQSRNTRKNINNQIKKSVFGKSQAEKGIKNVERITTKEKSGFSPLVTQLIAQLPPKRAQRVNLILRKLRQKLSFDPILIKKIQSQLVFFVEKRFGPPLPIPPHLVLKRWKITISSGKDNKNKKTLILPVGVVNGISPRKAVGLPILERLIVEYYSRN